MQLIRWNGFLHALPRSSMSTPAVTLTELLTLAPGDHRDRFVGRPERYGAIGVYGGHFLGQALAAAFATVEERKLANSFHGYFLRAGDPESAIVYDVEHLRDGKSFDTRAVRAIQHDQVVFHMVASFKAMESGEIHQKPMPPAPDVDELIRKRESENGARIRFPMTMGDRVEMEMVSETFLPAEFVPGRKPELRSWLRVRDAEGADARMTQCMLAFLADGTLMFNSVLPHGVPFRTHRLTSLDQSAWFHRGCDVGAWMLCDQRSTVVADGRGLNEGELFDAAGNLVMSVSQESMLRKISSGHVNER